MRGHAVKPKGRNRCYTVVDLGTDPVTGKRRQKSHASWATEREAEAALAGILGPIHDGSYVEPDRATVRGFLLDEWLPAVKPTLRPSTHKLYETLATAYVVPRVGDVKLQKLSPGQLNRLYAQLLESGAREGKPLGAESVRKVHRLMHRALRDAVKWGRVTRNVATAADPPRATRPEPRAWSPTDVTTFLTHASGDDLAGLWLLLLTTGLRRAEALGLAWSNVGAVAVPVRAGSVVVFSSLTPHATGYNVTDEERKAYILQYAPEGAVARRGDPAGPPGPPQPQNDAERQFLVARGGEPIETSIT